MISRNESFGAVADPPAPLSFGLGRRLAWTAAALCLGAALTGLLWYAGRDRAESEQRRQFEAETQAVEKAIVSRVAAFEQVLRDVRGLIDAQPRGAMPDLVAYLASAEVALRFPEVRRIGYLQRVPAVALAEHEAAMRARGFPEYRVRHAGERREYFPHVYVYPFEAAGGLLGFDPSLDGVEREAMERARDGSVPAASGRLALAGDATAPGMLLYLPVFAGPSPADAGRRQAALSGFVYAGIRVDEMLRAVAAGLKSHGVDFEVFDGHGLGPQALLYDEDGMLHAGEEGYRPALARTALLDVAGRQWTVYFVGRPGSPYVESALSRHILLVGAAFTLLLGMFAWSRGGDAARRRLAELALRHSSHRLEALIEAVPLGVVVMDGAGAVQRWNPAAQRLFGWTEAEVIGRPLASLPVGTGSAADGWLEPAAGAAPVEVEMVSRDGARFTVEVSTASLPDAHGAPAGSVAMVADVTQRKRSEEQLRYLANFDPLTGLPNGVLLHDRLQRAVSHAERGGGVVAVLLVDLDQFAQVNSSLGRTVGDALLRTVAGRLTACVRHADSVARQGADEFLVVLPQISREEDAAAVAAKMLDACSQPILAGRRELHLSASIGISLFPRDGRDPGTLIRHAERAMYRAKDCGRGNVQFFNPELMQRAHERSELEAALRQAMERDELFLEFQPVVDNRTGGLAGAEALLRWRHPELGVLPPARFIPLAEEAGLMGTIGDWVIRQACDAARRWVAGRPEFRIAINVSARQVADPGLVKRVEQVLAEAGLAAGHLQLEIAEGAATECGEAAIGVLEGLRRLGAHVALDDFGTGYTSLAYLKRLPVNTLKIDRSLVRDLFSDEGDAAIVSATIALARSLKLRVVAEGVETREQWDCLRGQGCDLAQGYLFGHPVPVDEFERLAGSAEPAWRAPLRAAV